MSTGFWSSNDNFGNSSATSANAGSPRGEVSNGFMGPWGSELWGPLSQYNDGTFVMFIARSLESAAAVVAITAQNHGEVTGYGGKLT